jgi:hypothetical protein
VSVNIATFNLLSENSERNALTLSIPPEGQTIHCQPNEVAAMKLQRLFKAHVNSILAKLAASGRTEAVTIAIKRGLSRLH